MTRAILFTRHFVLPAAAVLAVMWAAGMLLWAVGGE